MGLSMCSSLFSESSPVRSKSDIINELSGFSNCSNSAMQLHQLKLAWSYRPCILHLLCRKTLVLSAEFGTKIKFDLSTFIQKLLVFIKNYSTTHRSDKMSHFLYLEILISGESYQSKTRYTYSNWCNSITKKKSRPPVKNVWKLCFWPMQKSSLRMYFSTPASVCSHRSQLIGV